ncbi:two component transcriptional regulator, winged helix family [Acidovorax delafieldii 2AN]|uniref:Two component transcriptional regulator, winged helix family n=1 Tax=Acidovorax delafieldii 2AN TaxID=573060 RepID=C5T3L8_ACIDE|nr:response regulator transcription factor [Acidovorax delafieldii]EER60924.1 two component transcriptional regulator, winged helix family [Acidovorax delafieldii 2AN]
MRIAALDDDALQLDLIKQATLAMGHTCHTHLHGADLLREMRRETFDLLIVDWHLPDMTGPDVVRWVRKNVGAQLPILFVTHRQEERDIIEGLGSGADDFMVKPVRIGELSARVAALLRRAYPASAGGEIVEFGRYRFLSETRSIEIDGVPVELKNREYDLALFLFQNMGRLLSRDHLKEIILGQVADVMSRSLDTHISRLRTLLDLRPSNGFIVSAVYGVGYRFEALETQQRA